MMTPSKKNKRKKMPVVNISPEERKRLTALCEEIMSEPVETEEVDPLVLGWEHMQSSRGWK